MNALLIFLQEPILSEVMPGFSASTSDKELLKRYRAMVSVLLEQLEGLKNTHVRFCHTPDDADDAVKFWLLPQLRGHTIKQGNNFLFTPKKHATPFTINFVAQGDGSLATRLERATKQAFDDGFEKVATLDAGCIHCGSRWINTAFLQTSANTCVIGSNQRGGYYLLATANNLSHHLKKISPESANALAEIETLAKQADLSVIHLPPLTTIADDASWSETLSSPIGGKLSAAITREE